MKRMLIRGGHVVDPANGIDGRCDILIDGDKIAEVGDSLAGGNTETVDAAGRIVIPGLVDTHVHISGSPEGCFMLARAGVTSCLDMNGMPEEMAGILEAANTGLTAGFLYPLTPHALSGADPGDLELRRVLARAVEQGAFGIKILGGHYPLTPAATARAVACAAEAGVYCAVHAGTTENGSDINGLRELIALAAGRPLHVAHVNSYCRGQVTGDPVEEALGALELLREAENVQSESYLGLINGTSARMIDGIPASKVTATCLRRGGYSADRAGMEAAVMEGWARVQGIEGDEWILLEPAAGLAAFRGADSRVKVSFAVNSPPAAIVLATARNPGGRFTVTALSTDGGRHPRNTTLKQGLALVQYGALSMSDLVSKAALDPARMLNLPEKGHLGAGADADLVVLSPAAPVPELVFAGGGAVVRNGALIRCQPCRRFSHQ